MLTLKIPAAEQWDQQKEEFVYTREYTITIEHSLVSVSKWEARWGRSFLAEPPKTRQETVDYVKCMTVTQNVPPEAYIGLTDGNLRDINKYIDAPMTATKINSPKTGKKGGRTVTSELIYYWMIEFGIPFECQIWHFNRLMTLIRVCEIEGAPKKKMSKNDIYSRNNALNKKRRQMMNSRG